MVEGTQSIQFLPGVILAVVVANWVAHHIHHDGELTKPQPLLAVIGP